MARKISRSWAIDNRLDWRDPNMPVLGRSGKAYPPETMQRIRLNELLTKAEPIWKNDPTYNLRRKNGHIRNKS